MGIKWWKACNSFYGTKWDSWGEGGETAAVRTVSFLWVSPGIVMNVSTNHGCCVNEVTDREDIWIASKSERDIKDFPPASSASQSPSPAVGAGGRGAPRWGLGAWPTQSSPKAVLQWKDSRGNGWYLPVLNPGLAENRTGWNLERATSPSPPQGRIFSPPAISDDCKPDLIQNPLVM